MLTPEIGDGGKWRSCLLSLKLPSVLMSHLDKLVEGVLQSESEKEDGDGWEDWMGWALG